MLVHQQNNSAVELARTQSFGDHKNRFFDESVSCREPQESGFMRGNASKTGEFFSSISALASFSGQAVTDFELARCEIAHQTKASDASASIAAQIHNEPTATFECGDSAINVFRYVYPNRAWEHRDFK